MISKCILETDDSLKYTTTHTMNSNTKNTFHKQNTIQISNGNIYQMSFKHEMYCYRNRHQQHIILTANRRNTKKITHTIAILYEMQAKKAHRLIPKTQEYWLCRNFHRWLAAHIDTRERKKLNVLSHYSLTLSNEKTNMTVIVNIENWLISQWLTKSRHPQGKGLLIRARKHICEKKKGRKNKKEHQNQQYKQTHKQTNKREEKHIYRIWFKQKIKVDIHQKRNNAQCNDSFHLIANH